MSAPVDAPARVESQGFERLVHGFVGKNALSIDGSESTSFLSSPRVHRLNEPVKKARESLRRKIGSVPQRNTPLRVAHVLCTIGNRPVYLATFSASKTCACTLHNRNILSADRSFVTSHCMACRCAFHQYNRNSRAKNSMFPHVHAGLDVAHVLCIIGTPGPRRD